MKSAERIAKEEKVIEIVKGMSREEQEQVLAFIENLKKEYSAEQAPAAQEQKYPDMVTNPEFYIDMLQGGE